VVGTGSEMVVHALDDRVSVTDGHDRLEKAIAAVVLDVGVSPAQSAQIVGVIGQRQVVLGECARDVQAG